MSNFVQERAAIKANLTKFKETYPDVVSWIDIAATKYQNHFAVSLQEQLFRNGSLTEKQITCVATIGAKLVEFNQDNPEVVSWLKAAVKSNDPDVGNFARSLQAQLFGNGSLSDSQIDAVRDQVDIVRQTTVEVGSLHTTFMGVTKHWLRSSSGITIVFQAGSNDWAGVVFVTSAVDGRKLGIIKNSKFTPQRDCSEAELAAVVDCCNDPTKAEATHAEHVRMLPGVDVTAPIKKRRRKEGSVIDDDNTQNTKEG